MQDGDGGGREISAGMAFECERDYREVLREDLVGGDLESRWAFMGLLLRCGCKAGDGEHFDGT